MSLADIGAVTYGFAIDYLIAPYIDQMDEASGKKPKSAAPQTAKDIEGVAVAAAMAFGGGHTVEEIRAAIAKDKIK